jgi:hypothetical protein
MHAQVRPLHPVDVGLEPGLVDHPEHVGIGVGEVPQAQVVDAIQQAVMDRMGGRPLKAGHQDYVHRRAGGLEVATQAAEFGPQAPIAVMEHLVVETGAEGFLDARRRKPFAHGEAARRGLWEIPDREEEGLLVKTGMPSGVGIDPPVIGVPRHGKHLLSTFACEHNARVLLA